MDNNYEYNRNNGESERQSDHSYEFYEVNKNSASTMTPTETVHHSREVRRHGSSIGKKIGFTVSMALVFGLVAGLVFQGVNLIGDKAFGTTDNSGNAASSTVESVQMEKNDAAVSSDASDAAKATPTSASYSVADIAQGAMPSVVAITAISVQEVQDFFGGTQQYEGVGSGSGIIIGQNDDELLIATNNHVVENSKNLSVTFYGDDVNAAALTSDSTQTGNESADDLAKEYAENSVSASIKGTDADNDLAVIAVKKTDVPDDTMGKIKVATMGDSDGLAVGEQVVAIGNALGYGQSVTSGYVSALDRAIESDENGSTTDGLIQTDAAINPGNSGGALLNMQGEVIGINSAKFADTTVEGMGFAIPISTANPILDDLSSRETRNVVSEEKAAYLGISCKEVSADVSSMYGIPTGVFVAEVSSGGAAEAAGIQSGDVITEFDKTKISSYNDLTDRLQYYEAGEKVELVIQRAEGGAYKAQTITITLGSKKDAEK